MSFGAAAWPFLFESLIISGEDALNLPERAEIGSQVLSSCNLKDGRAGSCGHDIVRLELPADGRKLPRQPTDRVQRISHDGSRPCGKDCLFEEKGGDFDLCHVSRREIGRVLAADSGDMQSEVGDGRLIPSERSANPAAKDPDRRAKGHYSVGRALKIDGLSGLREGSPHRENELALGADCPRR
jgi:hypothetical protein